MMKKISRRKFIGQAGCATIGSTTFFNSFFNLGMSSALASPSSKNDYKALVCILLAGGNDSFNMLIPGSIQAYNEYQATRSNLSLAQADLLNLNFTDLNGKTYGLHPAMPDIQQLFNTGKASFIANAGTLIEPTSKTQILNNSVPLPLGLMSHADQIQQWQTSIPQSRSARGWGGRVADILSTINTNQSISMNISLGGTNVFQAGETAVEYAIRNEDNGSIGIDVYESTNFYDQILRNSVDNLLSQQYQDIFKQSYRDKVIQSQQSHLEFSTAIGSVPSFNTQFSNTKLSADLHMAAKTIAARNTLDMKRQTFFIEIGGWDHHDEVLNNQMSMLTIVNNALAEFQAAMEELNISDSVTTFTISDFGRTLTSNGNGSDHGWGGHALVMGGDLVAGKIVGEYPSLALGGNLEIGGGVLIPQISTDEYFAELALWFGLDPSDLSYVLPNIGNFYTPGSVNAPLGFLNL
jgi:uncharacterized protein (DUF1501 family)